MLLDHPQVWASVPQEGPMQRLNLNFWMFIGRALGRGDDLKSQMTAGEVGRCLIYVDGACEAALEDEVVKLDFATSAAKALQSEVKKVQDTIDALEGADYQKPLEESVLNGVKSAHSRLKNLLAEDLSRKNIYAVRESEIYSVSALIEHGEAIIPAPLRPDLPGACVEELKAAGRCLAFELATASAFHVMRAIEVVLLENWDALMNRSRPDNRNWGGLLRDMTNNGGDANVIAAVTHVKDLHRNPIVHPELTLDMNEALLLWGSAPSAIIALVNDTKRRRPQPQPNALAAIMRAPGM